jgi:hypothetical protein
MKDRSLFVPWIFATWLGWLLGIPCIILLALLGEAVGIGGAQAIVGAGMGTGVGLMQRRIVRNLVGKSAHWIWSNVIGLWSLDKHQSQFLSRCGYAALCAVGLCPTGAIS